jgi:alpha-tubulin suppressor-like RCC1 family protein
VTATGTLRCWGYNDSGQATVPSDLGSVSQVSAGWDYTCAVTVAGTLRCWGRNLYGQAMVPSNLSSVSQVSAGGGHTCAVTSVGTLRCWGWNLNRQATVPGDLGSVSHVRAGGGHTCAVTAAGTLRCWGYNDSGQATVPGDLGSVSQISAGYSHTCAVTAVGTLRCWGYNDSGQATVPGDLGSVSQVSAGYSHTCAVTAVGTLRCWGYNDSGQATVPGDLGSVSQVSVGDDHTCAVTAAEMLRCWGRNDDGQATVPTDLGSVSQVSAGGDHTCAVTAAGTLRCWGRNDDGQATVPTDLGSVSQISAGLYHTCALTAAGTLRCWGWNSSGQSTIPRDPLGPPTVPGVCAQFVADLNYPDGTAVNAGASFTKRWQLRNCGDTPWSNDYQAVRTGGSYGPASFAVSAAAGATVEVAAPFTAPTAPGVHRATYRLQGPGGFFGDPFWVEVRVRSGSAPTYTISGRVTNNQSGLAGVRMNAIGSTTAEAFTGADGRYTLSGLPAGTYTLTAFRDGFTFGSSRSITLPPAASGQDFTAISAAPPTARQVAVIVHGINLSPDMTSYTCEPTRFNPDQHAFAGSGVEVPNWDRVGQRLVALGYEVYLANWTTSLVTTLRVEDAARDCLAPQIASVAERDRDKQVLLLTHSMGGLVSRAYIENSDLNKDKNVEALITLGTPHVGVNANTLIKILAHLNPKTNLASNVICLVNPGLCQLGSDEMLLFNMVHQPRGDVPYLFIGGSGGPDWMGFVNITEGRNDGIVGFRSATGYQYRHASSVPFIGQPLRDDFLVVRGTDITRRYSDSSHSSIFPASKPWFFGDAKVDECVVAYLVNRSSSVCSTMREPMLTALPAQAAPPLPAYTPLVNGTLRTGEIVTVQLELDGTLANVLLGSSDGQLSLSLTAPDGTEVTAANVGQVLPGGQYSGPTTSEDPATIAYTLPNPARGRWIATIAATDVLTETTYSMFAALQSSLTIDVERPSSVAAGQPFQIQATLSEGPTPVNGATVSASLPTVQGPQVVTLTRTAPGVYSGQMIAPATAGPHLFTVTATGSTATPFARQFDDLITVRANGVQRQGAAIATPIDRDGNGRYEALEVTAQYTAAAAGDYAVLATLQDASGRAIALASEQTTWTVGSNSVTFAFDGGEILAGGVNGPYRVAAQIVLAEGARLMADEQPLIDKLNYQASDFEGATQIQRVYLPLLRRS